MTTINRPTVENLNPTQEPGTRFDNAFHLALEAVGERYGIYVAMTQTGPVTPQELAGYTALPEQHIRMWLQAQASAGWLYHSPAANRYCLWCLWSPRQIQEWRPN